MLEIPVCCLVAAVASEVGSVCVGVCVCVCVCVWREGEVVREGGEKGRERE